MTDRVADAQYVRQIELRSIHLHAATHQRGTGRLTDEVDLTSKGELEPHLDEESGHLSYLVSMEYCIAEPGLSGDKAVASGSVAHTVTYDLLNDLKLTEEQVAEFAYAGAIFHVHPYIREHIAMMCTRSGIPPFVLPMLVHDPASRHDD